MDAGISTRNWHDLLKWEICIKSQNTLRRSMIHCWITTAAFSLWNNCKKGKVCCKYRFLFYIVKKIFCLSLESFFPNFESIMNSTLISWQNYVKTTRKRKKDLNLPVNCGQNITFITLTYSLLVRIHLVHTINMYYALFTN